MLHCGNYFWNHFHEYRAAHICQPWHLFAGISSHGSGGGQRVHDDGGSGGVMEAAPAANPDVLTAFASISNVISSSISVYLGLFITVPLGNVIYKAMKKGK